MSTAIEDMIKELNCNNCRDKRVCNGTDLMNCYAEKKLTIKPKAIKILRKDQKILDAEK
jgi:hypothetical protein